MTKHRKTRRSQKGGDWLSPSTWFGSSDPYAPKKSIWDSMTGATSSATSSVTQGASNLANQAEGLLGSAASGITSGVGNAWESTKNMMSTDVDLTGSTAPMSTAPMSTAPMSTAPMSTAPMSTATAPMTNSMNSYQNPQQEQQMSSYGGKRRRRSMTKSKIMKGGKGGLGLTYYASPVSGIKVAQPTSWQYYANGTNQYSVKGGSKKRRKGRKSRKSRKTNRK
jgi:hypothetical protein